ncbi:hypothetical protein ACFSKW_00790 [Nonomuraea mangrovi]|uniref:DUF2178 domain-containing protein n=1 Tax=Nonomuraea mangrovi TaxID=2316207 RepID=A0ABW4SKD3_9ACTN
METNENVDRPSPLEAAAALDAARQARAAGNTPIQGWFFPVISLLVAGIMVAQMLADTTPLVTIALLAVIGAGWWLTERLYSRQVDRAGIAPRELTLRRQLVLAAPLPALWIAAELLDHRGNWVWVAAALLSMGWIIGYGIVHNRRARTSA